MKKIYIAFMTVAALAAVSCNTKEEYGSLPTGEVMFTAVQADNPESKTILQSDGSVFWSAGDSINLFYGTAGSAKLISNNSEPVQQTTFSGSLGGYNHNGSDYFHAVYPYSAENTFDGTAFTVTLPEVQSSVAGSFADDLFISMARSQDYTLQFYNLCGGVKFSVSEAGIKYVTFRGNNNEPLAGKVNVIFNDDGKPVVQTVVDGKTELRLDAPNGGTFEPGEWYYMVSLPATLSAGYTMTFYKDEKYAERVTDSSISIKRAVWGRLTNADGIHTKPEAVDLGLPSGVKWASFNLGASAPEEAGLFFAWGEILPKSGEGTWENYKYGESTTVLSKYNEEDGLTELLLEDDAAHILLGEGWRMPTYEELDELDSYCTETLTSRNGVDGYEFVSNINHNSIFIPFYSEDSDGYWSKTLQRYDDRYEYARCLHLEKNGPSYTHAGYGSWRCMLKPIRPVYDDSFAPELNYCIYYTSTDGKVVSPSAEDVFGANIVSNTYSDGRGVISFDGPVTRIGDKAFSQCDRLETISIPEGCTTIGNDAFQYDRSLISIHLPSTIKTIVGYSIYGCESLQEINLPEGLTYIGNWAFCGCSSLEEITIPQSVNSMGGAFAGCVNLSLFKGKFADASGKYLTDDVSLMGIAPSGMTSYTVPDGIKNILDGVFCSFGNLTEIILPKGLSSIGFQSFRGCTGLTKIVIPESVTFIGNTAFQGCSNLTSILCLPITPPTGSKDMFLRTGDCPIYVPAESVDTYKSAAFWSDYADRIQAIPDNTIPEAVDLGLTSGLKWATCNVGANAPEEYGDYFAWGETEPYYSSQDPLTWKDGKSAGYYWASYKFELGTDYHGPFSKYVTNSSYGTVDNNTVLDPEDDAAHVNLGGSWRMPTDQEWTELRTECTWTWTTQNGVNGRLVTGPNGNSIFLPAAGDRYYADLYYAASRGDYWSSSLYTGYPYGAYLVYFYSDDVYRGHDFRCLGFSVRPVTE